MDRFQREEDEYFRRNRGLKEALAREKERHAAFAREREENDESRCRKFEPRKFTNFRNRNLRGGGHRSPFRGSEASTSGDGRGGRSERGDRDGRPDRPRPPPHLRGRAIGLWYAHQNKLKGGDSKKKKEHKMEGLVTINIKPQKEFQIRTMLQNLPQHLTSSELVALSNLGENTGTKSEPSTSHAVSDGVSTASRYQNISESSFKKDYMRNLTESIDSKIERLLQSQLALERNPTTDRLLREKLLDKKENSQNYKKMFETRKRLPSFQMQDSIVDLVRQNQVVVLSGETGCGKTTQVPQFILDDYILRGEGSMCRIICTQPRRISATSVAERVAAERDEVIGKVSVGYQIRLEKAVAPKQGSILFCTTGVLLEWMKSDPSLPDTSHIILDEIHERDTVSDFVITLLKDILPKRPDLKIVLMSATLNADHFTNYFNSCPSLNIPGFTFPVEEFYLEDVIEMLKFKFPPARRSFTREKEFGEVIGPYIRSLEAEKKYSRSTIEALRDPQAEKICTELIVSLTEYICKNKPDGAILIFLPGWEDISHAHNLFSSQKYFTSGQFSIIPLHSLMPTTVQKSVFDRPPPGVRKIIIATNIAETSITIDDVVYVVDCGKIKMKNYDAENDIQTLKAEWVSVANAKQRRGRAGRVQPGVCYHLYMKAREMTFQSYPLPEMLRSRLDEVIIKIKILQLGAVRPFLKRVMNPPDDLAVKHSIELLELMNVLDTNEYLTPLGYHLGKLPMDPHTGKMILMGALFGCVEPVCAVAASLNFKDPFMIPLGKEHLVDRAKVRLSGENKSDLLLIANVLLEWEVESEKGRGRQFCYNNFLSENTLRMLRDLKNQFVHHLYDMKFLQSSNPEAPESNVNSSNSSLVKAIICAGLYPNVAFQHKVRMLKNGRVVRKMTTPQDGRVVLHPKSVNDKVVDFPSPFFVYHLKLKSMSITLHDSTMVYPLPLLFFGESLKFYVENNKEMVAIGKHFHVRCKKSVASIVMVLREHLNLLLEYKVSHPDIINWEDKEDPQANLLRAIVELITYEETGVVIQDHSDDSDSDDMLDE